VRNAKNPSPRWSLDAEQGTYAGRNGRPAEQRIAPDMWEESTFPNGRVFQEVWPAANSRPQHDGRGSTVRPRRVPAWRDDGPLRLRKGRTAGAEWDESMVGEVRVANTRLL